MAKLLIVEDEADIRELISFNLEMSGYEVEKARDGEEGLALAKGGDFDLIILDLMLPGMDGLKVCSQLRKDPSTATVPVIMLTARSEDDDIISGLETGADDYITKPFSPRILIARVKAALRRTASEGKEENSDRIIRIHDIVIDTARHETHLAGEPINLSATEFGILRFLAKNPGWVFSRNQIIDSVKGEDYPVTARSVDVQILGIRKKLGDRGNIIETVRGIGYRMKGE
ncbi:MULTISPECIES: response regulator [unclassified Oceanispirochaeta]|uniref:response regulator n=1 Tax=unclassified Oceanispirochaeta TaxID=2635722 RepID=UPI000E09478E|nr:MULTISPECIES: response regulator [unclassified Oceanispirochaeta]MBF9014475.1 response regulator [Oceanispirochaeta sp. M2]NPD70731.1 response regulator [Oceanispirochaeta sp. M1]RDG34014.1 response regulator [Oceanispirochaeta sp. M1]